MTSTTTTARSLLHLDPPKFSVDDDEEDEDIELWSFRLPVAFPLTALKGLELSITGGGVTKLSADGIEYRLEPGDVQDTESFRVLVPKKHNNRNKKNKTNGEDDSHSDSDSSSSDHDNEVKDSGKIPKMVPLKKSFVRHFSVLVDVPHKAETQLAPREGPPPQDTMRHAYSHVPQRSGLKRRWMPLGVTSTTTTTVTARREGGPTTVAVPAVSTATKQRSDSDKEESKGSSSKKRKTTGDASLPDSDASSDAADDAKLSKSERKAKKAEKKAAKKAKKEAKKAKKESKKVKEER
jgi:hypothetical protein